LRWGVDGFVGLGVRRARISSQCIKRAMRTHPVFRQTTRVPTRPTRSALSPWYKRSITWREVVMVPPQTVCSSLPVRTSWVASPSVHSRLIGLYILIAPEVRPRMKARLLTENKRSEGTQGGLALETGGNDALHKVPLCHKEQDQARQRDDNARGHQQVILGRPGR